MMLIDRYIIKRFLINFVILFLLLFVFAISIDLILQLDRFIRVARETAANPESGLSVTVEFIGIVINFHGPRLFQFYAYLHGLIAVGAMGFTGASMLRGPKETRELTALIASGMSLQRLAAPLLVAAFGLNVVQVLNSELVVPALAPLLVRQHDEIGKKSLSAFEIPFATDGAGTLFQSPSFDLDEQTLRFPTILERDEKGLTRTRVAADTAVWDEAAGGWRLENATVMRRIPPRPGAAPGDVAGMTSVAPIDLYETDLSPDVLAMKHFRQYASMLSLAQIEEMIDTPGVVDVAALARFKYARIASVLVNLLVLAIAIPFFLRRAPANMLQQSLLCAASTLPMMLLAVIVITVPIADIPPAASVFIPVIVLFPIAAWRVASTPT